MADMEQLNYYLSYKSVTRAKNKSKHNKAIQIKRIKKLIILKKVLIKKELIFTPKRLDVYTKKS